MAVAVAVAIAAIAVAVCAEHVAAVGAHVQTDRQRWQLVSE
jgi:hypothetical protein